MTKYINAWATEVKYKNCICNCYCIVLVKKYKKKVWKCDCEKNEVWSV